MSKKSKLYPIVPAILVLMAILYAVWSIREANRYVADYTSDGSIGQSILLNMGNTVPVTALLLMLAALSWKVHQRQQQVLTTWHKSKRTVARITLDLEALDVTYLTIPVEKRTSELEDVYTSLKNLCLGLLADQERIEKLRTGSGAFRREVATYQQGSERLEELAQTLMSSGHYYGPAENIQTVFDLLMRPVSMRVREILFFAEDIPGTPIPPKLTVWMRRTFEKLRAITHESHRDALNPAPHLDQLLFRWREAEQELAAAAREFTAFLDRSTTARPAAANFDVAGSANRTPSLQLLRKVLGLPSGGQGASEVYLEDAARLAYLHSDQSWRPKSQIPGYQKRMSIRQALQVRDFIATHDETAFKARVIASRFDDLMPAPPRRPRFGILSKIIIGIGLLLSGLLLLVMFAIASGDYERLREAEADSWFIARYMVSSFFSIAVFALIPVFAFLLVRALLLYLFSGTYLLLSQQSRRFTAARRHLNKLLLSLDETELSIVAAQVPPLPELSAEAVTPKKRRFHRKKQPLPAAPVAPNQHLSSTLIRRQLALVTRDLTYYESLPGSVKASVEGEEVLTEAEYSLGLLAEEFQDVETASRSALKR